VLADQGVAFLTWGIVGSNRALSAQKYAKP
jgi:hypothetical protein